MRLINSLIFTLITLSTAQAAIIKSSEAGFIIEHSANVDQSNTSVFSNMTDQIDQWWNPDHSYSGNSTNMTLDQQCFCERWDDNLVFHLNTLTWIKNSQVVLQGGLGPLKDFGLQGTMIWSLVAPDENSTKITWKYYVNGLTDTDLVALAPVVDAVLAEQLSRLLKHIES